MRIKQIELDNAGTPSSVTAVLTNREAVLIARMVGKTNGRQRSEIQSDGSEVGSEVFDCLSTLFNMFYDDGIDHHPR